MALDRLLLKMKKSYEGLFCSIFYALQESAKKIASKCVFANRTLQKRLANCVQKTSICITAI
jgi:hypothetical protein